MQLLYWLESIRAPWLDHVMLVITELGGELVFMALAIVIFWCVDKRKGYYMLSVGFVGTILNQFLKIACRISRPWVQDPKFTIVEAARAEATGYSFPSGHTQNAATTLGCSARMVTMRAAKIALWVLYALVAFSRMYLGVHTPLDVSVSLVTGFLTVAGMVALFDKTEGCAKGRAALCAGVIGLALVLVLYVSFAPKRAANIAEFDAHGVKNAYSLLGGMIGMVIAYYLDEKKTHYSTKAVWWAQIIKLVGGFVLVLAMKEGLKPFLTPLFGGHNVAHAIRYGMMTLVGAGLWPMTFGYFSKLGKE